VNRPNRNPRGRIRHAIRSLETIRGYDLPARSSTIPGRGDLTSSSPLRQGRHVAGRSSETERMAWSVRAADGLLRFVWEDSEADPEPTQR
jgi:hypothetical protein